MDFEWDESKYRTNIRKHGIDFADAVKIFAGPIVTDIDGRFDYGEVRKVTTGAIDRVVIITVIHTDRYGRTRIISARLASAKERKRYEAAIRPSLDDRGTGPDQG